MRRQVLILGISAAILGISLWNPGLYYLGRTEIAPTTLGTGSTVETTSTGETINRRVEDGNAFPVIGRTSRIEPPMSYPGGAITFQVFVTDPDGVDTISTITADLFPMNGPRVRLQPKAKENDGRWWEATVEVPQRAGPGKYNIEILATDKGGKSAFAKRPVTIVQDESKVVLKPRGPVIQKVYTEPNTIDIGITKDLYIYAEVRDEDEVEDIQAVTVDLKGLGREGRHAMSKVRDLDRFTGLYAFKVKDADYILSLSGGLSYLVESVDTLVERHQLKGVLLPTPIKEIRSLEQTEALDMQTTTGNIISLHKKDAAVTVVEKDILEIALPVSLDIASFRTSGADVTLTTQEDTQRPLRVSRAVLNGVGNVIRVHTSTLVAGKQYALWVNDSARVGSGSTVVFTEKPTVTYQTKQAGPLRMTTADITDTREVTFTLSKSIIFSSILPAGVNCQILDTRTTPARPLQNTGVQFLSHRSFAITMAEDLQPTIPYRYTCRDIQESFTSASAARSLLTGTLTREQTKLPFDLNGDGKISILDFTIFTRDYATFALFH